MEQIQDAISTLSEHWPAIQTLAITVVLFELGRRLLNKLDDDDDDDDGDPYSYENDHDGSKARVSGNVPWYDK